MNWNRSGLVPVPAVTKFQSRISSGGCAPFCVRSTAVFAAGSGSGNGNGAEWKVTLPTERTYRAADVEYEILSASARPDVSGKIALTLTLRCTNHGRYDLNFWDSTFRLNVSGVSYSPDPGLNELVAGDSSKSGDVRFTVPADTRDALLRIKFAEGESSARLAVSPP
jgi:hypothetical protein